MQEINLARHKKFPIVLYRVKRTSAGENSTTLEQNKEEIRQKVSFSLAKLKLINIMYDRIMHERNDCV